MPKDGVRAPLLGGSEDSLQRARSACVLHDECFLSVGKAKSSEASSRVQRKLWIATGLAFCFMIAEIVGGYLARSVAIMSDAAHMLSDVSAFLVAIFAAWAATQRSTWHYTFGYHRVEILGALISVLIIWMLSGALVFEAVQRVINPVRVDGKLMFIIASAGILFNVVMALTLGVHAHHGCSHSHEHGHSSSTGHSHSNSHGQSHNHSHSGPCSHNHDHNHDHEGHGSSSSGSSCSSHHHHGEEAAAPEAAAAAAAAASGAAAAAAVSAFAEAAAADSDPTGRNSIDIEVRCVLPPPVNRPHPPGRDDASSHHHGHGHDHDHPHDRENINLRGAVLHVIGDLVQSAGVALAGALIWYNQDDPRWYIADPICTFVFSVLVLLTTSQVLRDIIQVLMERTPRSMDVPELLQAMQDQDGIDDVHDLHVWNISTGIPVLTAHVHLSEGADAASVLQQLEQSLQRRGIKHSTVQICNPSALA